MCTVHASNRKLTIRQSRNSQKQSTMLETSQSPVPLECYDDKCSVLHRTSDCTIRLLPISDQHSCLFA